MLEGAKVLEAALDAGARVESVYLAPGATTSALCAEVVRRAQAAGVRVFPLAQGVMERVADTVTPQPICAVVASRDVPLESLLEKTFLLVCVDVRDPGNLGSILRSAAAGGADGVVCCQGSADPYNPKVVRASAGALFQVPFALAGEPGEVLDTLGESGYTRLATVARGGEDYATAELPERLALLLGNEAGGLPEELSARSDGGVTIPMAPAAESLNVAMAATVLVFEVARRRRLAGAPGPFEAGAPQPLA
ncbi:MAG: rRNA methylase [Acidimicrobiaceae bacterium]|nr:rRNA methylase [Acidimicrobiaceae bacterium]